MADKPKKKIRVGPPRNPDDDWNDPVISVAATLQLIKDVQQQIKDAAPDVWRKAYEYFDGTEKRLTGIAETIAATGKVSKPQREVVDRAVAGVAKWTAPR